MDSKKTIHIRLKKSLIGCSPAQRCLVYALGLRKREQERVLENTPAVRGMIKKVLHLVDILAETR